VRRLARLLDRAGDPSAKTTNGPEALPSANGWNTTL
jgi:hypothetical protein